MWVLLGITRAKLLKQSLDRREKVLSILSYKNFFQENKNRGDFKWKLLWLFLLWSHPNPSITEPLRRAALMEGISALNKNENTTPNLSPAEIHGLKAAQSSGTDCAGEVMGAEAAGRTKWHWEGRNSGWNNHRLRMRQKWLTSTGNSDGRC